MSNCEHCGQSNSIVTYTRDFMSYRKRRRKCLACGDWFTTIEITLPSKRDIFINIERKLKNSSISVCEGNKTDAFNASRDIINLIKEKYKEDEL